MILTEVLFCDTTLRVGVVNSLVLVRICCVGAAMDITCSMTETFLDSIFFSSMGLRAPTVHAGDLRTRKEEFRYVVNIQKIMNKYWACCAGAALILLCKWRSNQTRLASQKLQLCLRLPRVMRLTHNFDVACTLVV